MKKALIISSYPAPYRVAVFKEMSKEFEVEVYFSTDRNENRNADWFCKSSDFEFKVLNTKENKADFNKVLKKIKRFDFVIPYDPVQPPSMKAILLCRLFGIPYFINCDGAVIKANIVRDFVKRFLFKGARACFSSGKSATRYFEYYGVSKKDIFEHKFTSVAEEDILESPVSNLQKIKCREALGLKELPTVVAIGQFIHRKGFDILLEAWKECRDEFQLVVIGGGEEKDKYINLIKQYQLKNVVLKDFMNKDMILNYYDASDIFVLPTREDIWGLVINEAMARGLPVITTDNCMAGIELVENDENGYIVPVNNAHELSQKIIMLLRENKIREKMAHNNIAKSRAYTMKAMAQRQIDVIKTQLVGGEK